MWPKWISPTFKEQEEEEGRRKTNCGPCIKEKDSWDSSYAIQGSLHVQWIKKFHLFSLFCIKAFSLQKTRFCCLLLLSHLTRQELWLTSKVDPFSLSQGTENNSLTNDASSHHGNQHSWKAHRKSITKLVLAVAKVNEIVSNCVLQWNSHELVEWIPPSQPLVTPTLHKSTLKSWGVFNSDWKKEKGKSHSAHVMWDILVSILTFYSDFCCFWVTLTFIMV